MGNKSIQTSWGGTRKNAGRKPLGEKRRVHRSVTIDPDIYASLITDAEALQQRGLKVKVSDGLNCRLRKNYKSEPNHLSPEELDWAKGEKQQAVRKPKH